MGQQELEECIDVILQVIKAVNDSLQQGNIRGLPEILYPLGSLVCQVSLRSVGPPPSLQLNLCVFVQEMFSVHIEKKQQSSQMFKSRRQARQVLLFDSQLVFCKEIILSDNLLQPTSQSVTVKAAWLI